MPRLAAALVGALWLSGCAETTVIRAYPPGTKVVVNGQVAGIGPTIDYSVPRSEMPSDGVFHYRAEREGYRPADGEFRTHIGNGRVVGTIFTLGVLFLFKSPATLPEEVAIVLDPVAPNAGVKGASSDDPTAQLKHLEELFNQGVITDEEYRRERYKVLHSL